MLLENQKLFENESSEEIIDAKILAELHFLAFICASTDQEVIEIQTNRH